MRPVLCVRPEPGLSATISHGAALGLEITGCPLSRIEPVQWDAPDPAAFDALLAGSANIFRHGGASFARLRNLPVLAVGATTATAAHEAGFCVARTGRGGLQNLLDELALEPDPPKRFLRLCGEDRVSLTLSNHHSLLEKTVYRSVPLCFDQRAVEVLDKSPVVLLHSAVTTGYFVNECNRLNVDRSAICLAALGPRIAEHAGEGWEDIATAPAPDDAALLAMVANMCK